MTKEYEARSRGAMKFDVTGDFPGVVDVRVGEVERVRVRLDGVEVGSDWIIEDDDTITLRLPRTSVGGVFSSVQINGGGGIFIGGNHAGSIVMRGNRVWVDGVEVTGQSGVASPRKSTLEIDLPGYSTLSADMGNGGLLVYGSGLLERLVFDLGNGSINASAKLLTVKGRTGNGKIIIEDMLGDAAVESGNGDISIDCFAPGKIRASSGNGDVVIRDRANLGRQLDARGRSGNGRVREPGW